MSQILSLKPRVTRNEAVERLERRGVFGWTSRALRGPLRSVAEVYIPFHLYKVEIVNGARRKTCLLGLEAVTGSLDLFWFDRLPGPEDTFCLETRNHPKPRLAERDAHERLRDKVRGMVFQSGFFRIRGLRIQVRPIPMEVHVPYWVGFFGRRQRASMAVLDAVRNRFEGAKARLLIHQWLAHHFPADDPPTPAYHLGPDGPGAGVLEGGTGGGSGSLSVTPLPSTMV